VAAEAVDVKVKQENEQVRGIKGDYKYGWHDATSYDEAPEKGLSHEVIEMMSDRKGEPAWMRKFRHKSLDIFERKPMPKWGADLSGIDFDDIYYYIKPMNQVKSWDDMPEDIKATWDKLGIPEAEKNYLGGVTAQYESEVVYHKTQEDLERRGILFMDMDSALREHPDIVKQYFGTVIPPADNKFSALNSAVWSGGSFIYVPPGVEVEIPLQAYFRINQENMGQFERTLIIVDQNSYVHYVEGCSAPVYTSDSLHSAVVEIIVKDHGRARYTTIQNWSNNVYNLVTKRATAATGAIMEWVDGNLGCLAQGSRVTTRGGIKPIELLVTGEDVLSFDETKGELCWRKVTAKRFSGYQPVREVSCGARRLLVTDNHPFYSYTYDSGAAKKLGRYALAYVRADRLQEAIVPATSIDYGEPWKLEVPEVTTEFLGSNQYAAEFGSVRERERRLAAYEQTTDDLMWLMGLFSGNGSIERAPASNGGTRWAKVVFSVPVEDSARARLTSVMEELLPGVAHTQHEDGVAVTYNSVELADFFEANGFISGALDKRLPDWTLSLPESQRLQLVAGILDSDDCAPHGRRGFSIKSVNSALLEDVGQVLTSLGIPALVHTGFSSERSVMIAGTKALARGSHRIEFPCDPRLVELVSHKLRQAVLAQAATKLPHFGTVGRSPIELPDAVQLRKVEVGTVMASVPTWDIEVEGTGNFVSEGFIVHNSKVTMKYPSIYLLGDHARGEVLSIAYAGEGQHQDAGGKVIHVASDTSSAITSKSISKDGGRAGYRGLVRIDEGAKHAKSHVICDALILDERSRSDTYPYIEIEEESSSVSHEATVSKVSDDQLFYLMSRGLGETEAMQMIVRGFIEPITKELPMEYAVELQRLVELQMEGSVG
jgi:Fe-S cluster assembly scaffold protein SufB